MVAHPEGALLLGRHVEAGHEPVQQGAEPLAKVGRQEAAPAGPDPAELPRERGGLGQGRGPQHRHEVLPVRAEGSTAGEEAPELLDHGPVGGRRRKVAVVEQLPEGGERRVGVLEPAGGQLLERHLAVGGSRGLPGEVGIRRQLAAVDREGREVGGEPQEHLVDRGSTQHLVEMVQGVVEGLGILVLAVDRHDRVEDLVDQPHRVERARGDHRVRRPRRAPLRRHRGGEAPDGPQVRHDGVARQAEEGGVHVKARPRRPPDVQLADLVDHPPSPVRHAAAAVRPAHGATGMPKRRISLIAASFVGVPFAAVFWAG